MAALAVKTTIVGSEFGSIGAEMGAPSPGRAHAHMDSIISTVAGM
jgi:hypothetical protein